MLTTDDTDVVSVEIRGYGCSTCDVALLRWRTSDGPFQSGYVAVVVDVNEGTVEGREHVCTGAGAATPAPNPEIAFDSRENAAQWLAHVSGSPRYSPQGFGWSALLDSAHNAEHAARLAADRLMGDGPATARLSEARRVLGLT